MNIEVRENYCRVLGQRDEINWVAELLTIDIPEAKYTKIYKQGRWDGRRRYFNRVSRTFAIGFLNKVLQAGKNKHITIDDMRSFPKVDISAQELKGIELRDYQKEAIAECLKQKTGLVEAATNSGKTAIFAGVIKKLYPMKTLIIIHRSEIFWQLKEMVEKYIGIKVGIITAGEVDIKPVTVAMITTLLNRIGKDDNITNFFEDVQCVIIDECLRGQTAITLPDGSKKGIKEIYEDDKIQSVLSFNLEKNIFEEKKILRKICTTRKWRENPVPLYDVMFEVVFNNKIKKSEITVTGNHKIYTMNRGYVRVDELIVGDPVKFEFARKKIEQFLYNHNGVVVSVKERKYERKKGATHGIKYVYNLEVEDNHNYFANNVLVSNCHRAKARSYESILSACKAVYRFGFSGTISPDTTPAGMQIRQWLGDVILKISNAELIEGGVSAVPKVYVYELDVKPKLDGVYNLAKTQLLSEKGEYTGSDLMKKVYNLSMQKGIVENEERNEKAIEVTKKHQNQSILIIVDLLEHGEIVEKMLNEAGINAVFISGQSEVRKSALDLFKREKLRVLISTSILDEGIDIASIQVLCFLAGKKSKRQLLQRVGRGLRKKEGLNEVSVYDFLDFGSKYLERHSRERIQIYKNEGFEISFI